MRISVAASITEDCVIRLALPTWSSGPHGEGWQVSDAQTVVVVHTIAASKARFVKVFILPFLVVLVVS